jgi:hypothetical protein
MQRRETSGSLGIYETVELRDMAAAAVGTR